MYFSNKYESSQKRNTNYKHNLTRFKIKIKIANIKIKLILMLTILTKSATHFNHKV